MPVFDTETKRKKKKTTPPLKTNKKPQRIKMPTQRLIYSFGIQNIMKVEVAILH